MNAVPGLPGYRDWEAIRTDGGVESWVAVQETFDRSVTIEVHGPDPVAVERGHRIARAMSRSSELTGSVPLLSAIQLADGRLALVTPRMSGSLAEQVGTMTMVRWHRWFTESTRALDALHSNGLVHGDVRPDNLVIDERDSMWLKHHRGLEDTPTISSAPPGATSKDDLTGLVSAFAKLRPADPMSDHLIEVLGSDGEHLVELNIADAAALGRFLAVEVNRPVKPVPVDTGPSDSDDGARSHRRNDHRRKVLIGFTALVLVAGIVAATKLLTVDRPTSVEAGTTGGPRALKPTTDTSTTMTGADTFPDREVVGGVALDISIGDGQACALLESGEAVCWGANLDLGPDVPVIDGSQDVVFDPRPFSIEGGPFDAVDIGPNGTGGEVVCAISDGGVACRGWEIVEMPTDIGDDELNRSDVLHPVRGVSTATAVTVGATHACALLSDRTVSCWGSNTVGQLGLGDFGDQTFYTATPVPGLTDVTTLEAGGATTCAVKSDKTVWCWGVAEPPISRQPVPQQRTGLPPVVEIAVGPDIACGTAEDDQLWCWGDFEAVFGIRDNSVFTPPTVIDLPTPVRQAAPLSGGLCVLDQSGSVWCNEYATMDFVKIEGIDGAVELASSSGGSCARFDGGSVSCWGPYVDWTDEQTDNTMIVGITGLG